MRVLKSIFTSKGELSSKRIFGGLGLIIIFGAYIYAVLTTSELPSCTEFITATCASLLGVEAVVSAIKSKNE